MHLISTNYNQRHIPVVPSHAVQGKVSHTYLEYNNLSKLNIKSKGSQEKPYIASHPLIDATTLVQLYKHVYSSQRIGLDKTLDY